MKISKKAAHVEPVKEALVQEVPANEPGACNGPNDCNEYSECVEYIRSAISSLGPKAKNDITAREAIANLSVVLFDLQ